MTGIALPLIPFHLAGLGAVTVYNIGILLSFALSGYGAFVLARIVTRDAVASLIAGVFYAFVSFKFDHLSHLQIIAGGWIPLTLAALLLFWRTGSAKHAALFAAAFVMNGLSSVYWLLFTSIAVAITIAFLEVAGHPFNRKRLALALAGATIVLLPFLLPYQVVAKSYRMQRTSIESMAASATWSDWFTASPASLIYGRQGAGHLERHLFPGVLPLILALAGAASVMRGGVPIGREWAGRGRLLIPAAIVLAIAGWVLVPWHKSDVPFTLAVVCALAALPWKKMENPVPWVAAIWVAIGFIGSFGENSFLHPFLFRVLEPFRATRAPARWAIIAYCGLAVLAAIGASRLGRLRFALLLVAIVEVIPRFTWNHVPAAFPPVYHWLARARPSCAIELPIGWNETEAYYVLASTVHRVPIMNGVSGFDPPLHQRLLDHSYDDAMLDLIAQNGATVVVVHPAAAKNVRSWVDRGALIELVRFPDGDAVYAISR